jgi:hypothetical protein
MLSCYIPVSQSDLTSVGTSFIFDLKGDSPVFTHLNNRLTGIVCTNF